MITREEAKVLLEDAVYKKAGAFDFKYLCTLDTIFDQQDQLQQHIKSLEAQLANTEQLTCEGCIYSICDAETYTECASACNKCIRQPYRKDMYNFIQNDTQ